VYEILKSAYKRQIGIEKLSCIKVECLKVMDHLHHMHAHTNTHTDVYTKPNFLSVIIYMVYTDLPQSPIKHSHKMLVL